MYIQAFFEGILAALGALVFELAMLAIFNLPSAENSFLALFLCVTIEEVLKYCVIRNHYLKSEFPHKIIRSAFFIGLGFSLTELFLKQLTYTQALALPVLGIFIIHILTSWLVGYSSLKKINQKILPALILLSINIALHFCYNFLILRD